MSEMGGREEHDAWGTSRRSALLPGLLMVHADLHNHTRLSDGSGDPAKAFGSLRAQGLDVAAITDHSTLASGVGSARLPRRLGGLDEHGWRMLSALADGAQDDGHFVAMRGFEWSHPLLGHINVWGTQRYTHPLRGARHGVGALWRWLLEPGGGPEGLASFNHPGGRGTSRFSGFKFEPRLVERLVGFEIFNKSDDYLFRTSSSSPESPLVECLGKGWRPALLGVSDEHGDDWGTPLGKGRTGLWVSELTRASVREALLARRSFATRERGLRLAVRAAGTVQGGELRHASGALRLEVDLDMGETQAGRPVSLQVLCHGSRMPRVAARLALEAPGPGAPPLALDADISAERDRWIVLRVSDPAGTVEPETCGPYRELGRSLAYASPIWLQA